MPQNFVGEAAPTASATMGTSSSAAQQATQSQAMMWQPATQLGQENAAAAQPSFHALNQPQAQQQHPQATAIPPPAASTAQLTPQQHQEMMNQFAQHAAMFSVFMQGESNPHTQAQALSAAASVPTMVPPVANPMVGTTATTPFAMGDFATMGAAGGSTSTAPTASATAAANDAFMAGAAAAAADAARMAHQQPTFVNAKQYMRIMKLYFGRMNARKAELTGQVVPSNRKDAPFQHLSRHNHAKKRPRGKHGRFLTGDELLEYYRQNPDKDPNNPLSNASEEQSMDDSTTDAKVAAVAATPKPANVMLASATTPMANKDDEPTRHPGLQVSPIVLPPLTAAAASAPLPATTTAALRDNSIDPLLSEAAEALREDEEDAQHPAKKRALDSLSF
jgi:CCAAT-binding transcription factor (CBF-B/NF-YA) subunit B